jgi:hypothetical protein
MVHKKGIAFRRHQRNTSKKIPKDATITDETDPLLGAPPKAVYSSTANHNSPAIRSTPGLNAFPTNNVPPAIPYPYPSPTPSLMVEAPLDFNPTNAPLDRDLETCIFGTTSNRDTEPKAITPSQSPRPSVIALPFRLLLSLIAWLWRLFSLCTGKRKIKPKCNEASSPETYSFTSQHKLPVGRPATRDSRFAPSPDPRPQDEGTKYRRDYPVLGGVARVDPAPVNEYTGYAVVEQDMFVPEMTVKGGFDGRPLLVERPRGSRDYARD